jgi:hypothetical protein
VQRRLAGIRKRPVHVSPALIRPTCSNNKKG